MQHISSGTNSHDLHLSHEKSVDCVSSPRRGSCRHAMPKDCLVILSSLLSADWADVLPTICSKRDYYKRSPLLFIQIYCYSCHCCSDSLAIHIDQCRCLLFYYPPPSPFYCLSLIVYSLEALVPESLSVSDAAEDAALQQSNS